MHRMTRPSSASDVEAPFAGEALRFKRDVATLEHRGSSRFVRIDSPGLPSRLYRVTRVLGGHHREDFVGVRVDGYGVEPAGHEELVLPVSYLFGSKSLRYKGYSVMVHERDRLEAGPVWNRTCIFCHNTAPYLSTLFGALAGGRVPPYQGEVVDGLLPDDRALRYRVRDEAAARAAAGREIALLGATPNEDGTLRRELLEAVDATRDRFTGDRLVELGIGCEACHGGARAHAVDPSVRPSYEPRAPFLEVTAPDAEGTRARASRVNHLCARCHQVLFTRYPWTWEGGQRHAVPGGSHISSGEGRDFLLSRCSLELACTDCHDPHASDEGAALRELETPRGNRVCLACHGDLASPAAQRAHTHHDPLGPAGACIACHMANKNMSLDSALSRYHRIGSPTDPLRVLGDRPLECALCHADKSIESLVSTMEAWWRKAYDRPALLRLYGDLHDNTLLATVRRGKPHEQAVALALATGRPAELAPLAAHELANDYPLVREYAKAALGRALGKPCDVPLAADLPAIEQAADACLAAAGLPPVLWPSPPALEPRPAPPED